MTEGLAGLCYSSGGGCYEKSMDTIKVKPRDIQTRDWALVRLLQGATKAGVQKDRRKEANRKACRKGGWTND